MMKGAMELGGEPQGSGVPTTTKGVEEVDPACASGCLFSPLPFPLHTLAKASLTERQRAPAKHRDAPGNLLPSLPVSLWSWLTLSSHMLPAGETMLAFSLTFRFPLSHNRRQTIK